MGAAWSMVDAEKAFEQLTRGMNDMANCRRNFPADARVTMPLIMPWFPAAIKLCAKLVLQNTMVLGRSALPCLRRPSSKYRHRLRSSSVRNSSVVHNYII